MVVGFVACGGGGSSFGRGGGSSLERGGGCWVWPATGSGISTKRPSFVDGDPHACENGCIWYHGGIGIGIGIGTSRLTNLRFLHIEKPSVVSRCKLRFERLELVTTASISQRLECGSCTSTRSPRWNWSGICWRCWICGCISDRSIAFVSWMISWCAPMSETELFAFKWESMIGFSSLTFLQNMSSLGLGLLSLSVFLHVAKAAGNLVPGDLSKQMFCNLYRSLCMAIGLRIVWRW